MAGLSHPEKHRPRGLPAKAQQTQQKQAVWGLHGQLESALWGSGQGHCGVRGLQTMERGVLVVGCLLRTPQSGGTSDCTPNTQKRHLHRTQGHGLILRLAPVPLVSPLRPDPAGARGSTVRGAGVKERTNGQTAKEEIAAPYWAGGREP